MQPDTYAFEIVTTDAPGNVDATPAKRTFTVAAPPVVTPPPVTPPPVIAPPPPVVENCVVPSLKGKTLAQAKTALAAAKCSVGTVKKTFSAKVKKGRVVRQAVAGRTLAKGAAVGVTLSTGRRR